MISNQSKDLVAKMIRLMASDNDHEIVAAVSAVKRILKKENKDLNDLAEMFLKPSGSYSYSDLHRAYSPPPPRKPRHKTRGPETQDEKKLKKILAVKDRLPEKSKEFIESVSERINAQEKMTEKQQKWFEDIYFKFCV
jgi:hypothetical protein